MGNKYHVAAAADRTAHGHVFDSKAEMKRYYELTMLERAREIRDLELQPRFELVPAYTTKAGEKVRALCYFADFRYLDLRDNRLIVEDVKGARTKEYLLKKKLLLWRYPEINFVEVKA
jgi:hypothetical protein